MTGLDTAGRPVRHEPVAGRQAIVRSDTGAVLGIHTTGYAPHQYGEWLLGVTSNILGDTLFIGSAGVLRGGALAWVQAELAENVTTTEGVAFRPNLLASTSFDGGVATNYKRTSTVVVCDNTYEIARREPGPTYRVRHSRHSGLRLNEARDALAIVEATADDFAAQVADLCASTVTDRQWSRFLAAWAPTERDGQPLTGRSLTSARVKQDTLDRMWRHDARVAPWKNTAWGVAQAVNTWGHHEQTIRGATRPERNMLNAITGATARADQDALDLLDRVLTAA
jgi:phage/plasmid-like protein (TIGR03299 family)